MISDADPKEQVRRHALGGFLHTWRARLGLSSLDMAAHVGLAHMTWRRIEDGYPARPKTYATVERSAGLAQGSVYRALASDDQLMELAGRLGIGPSEGQGASEFIASFAWPTTWAQQHKRAPRVDSNAVQTVLEQLMSLTDRSDVEETLLSALAAWTAELAGGRVSSSEG
jgi:transcriptional regulator with XRE-family HTH domain